MRGRALWLEVTDAGWAWANDNLNAKLPAKTQSAGPILQAWLTHLHSFLRRNGIALAEIVAPAHEELGSKSAPLQERISRAYLTAAGGAWNARVRLSELRGLLADVSRDALDRELLNMQQSSKLVLYRLDNQREITDDDREAAIPIGGEPRHVLRMGG